MTRDRERTELSKFLSYVLRHNPQAIGITLDANGWVDVAQLLEACANNGRTISRSTLEEIVTTSPKQRFALNADQTKIRANQGHSIDVDLGYAPAIPPDILFHGTVPQSLPAIREAGLRKMARHHVHLSPDAHTAQMVGQRRGKAVILRVRAGAMHADGHQFFISTNAVWLTDHVPTKYIEFPDG